LEFRRPLTQLSGPFRPNAIRFYQMSPRRAVCGGLPHHCVGSATTLNVSRPAQRSLALWPVGSPSRRGDPSAPEGSDGLDSPRVALRATDWTDPRLKQAETGHVLRLTW
jgi:hypothetical protein